VEANGTWLGMNRQGKISFITNYRDIQNIKQAAPSRGLLVSDYLENNTTPKDYLTAVAPFAHQYNGFNLVVGDVNSLWYLSNYRKGITKVDNGFYGLSNHLLETPWPKILRGKEILTPILQKNVIDVNEIMEALRDTNRAEDDKLPDTGIGLERERALSSMFIKSPGYGSRCTTVILVDNSNFVTFCERTYDLETFQFTTETFQFKVSLTPV